MADFLDEMIGDAKTIAVSGHIHADGDSVGAVLAAYLYLKNAFPGRTVHPYLDGASKSFSMLSGLSDIDSVFTVPEEPYDLFISLDCGSSDRLGKCEPLFRAAKHTIQFDHHITNTEFAEENYVNSAASSTCEILFDFMRKDMIDLPVAEALYTGILHDTGVFKYSCTSEKTMCTAGFLMSRGIDTATLIDRTFYMKTFSQLKTLGYALNKSEQVLGGKMVLSVLTAADMRAIGATVADTEGIVSELRTTEGVEVAVFVREDAPETYKFSLRSNGRVDVSSISASFGGGGHRLASGFTAKGNLENILTEVYAMVMLQL